jgi:diguanylate cyclase (GGDEF)-like protein/PAS domain S-box-containing protein
MLWLNENELRAVFDHAPLPMHVLGPEGKILWVNSAWRALLGYSKDAALGRTLASIAAPESVEALAAHFRELKAGAIALDTEVALMSASATPVSLSLTSRVFPPAGAGQGFTYSVLFDIRRRKMLEFELTGMTMKDYLTGAYNRRAAMEIVNTEISRVDRYGGDLSVLMVDVGGMQRINRVYGSRAGDAVLVRVAEVVGMHKRASDSICRYGGDEFLVILPGTDADGAVTYAERLAPAVKVSLDDGSAISLFLSVGVAEFNDEVLDADALVANAESALAEASAAGGGLILYGG